MLKRFKKNNKGFTLVELMVVVVILAVLVAIAVPIYNNITGDAQKRACHANLRTIDAAKTQFEASKASGSSLTWPDDFFVGKKLPKCPSGGEYRNTDPEVKDAAYCSEHQSYAPSATATPTTP